MAITIPRSATESEIAQAQSLIARGKEGAAQGDPKMLRIISGIKYLSQEQVRTHIKKLQLAGKDVSQVDVTKTIFGGANITGVKTPTTKVGETVFVNGQGFSVLPGKKEEFIKQQTAMGGVITSTPQTGFKKFLISDETKIAKTPIGTSIMFSDLIQKSDKGFTQEFGTRTDLGKGIPTFDIQTQPYLKRTGTDEIFHIDPTRIGYQKERLATKEEEEFYKKEEGISMFSAEQKRLKDRGFFEKQKDVWTEGFGTGVVKPIEFGFGKVGITDVRLGKVHDVLFTPPPRTGKFPDWAYSGFEGLSGIAGGFAPKTTGELAFTAGSFGVGFATSKVIRGGIAGAGYFGGRISGLKGLQIATKGTKATAIGGGALFTGGIVLGTGMEVMVTPTAFEKGKVIGKTTRELSAFGFGAYKGSKGGLPFFGRQEKFVGGILEQKGQIDLLVKKGIFKPETGKALEAGLELELMFRGFKDVPITKGVPDIIPKDFTLQEKVVVEKFLMEKDPLLFGGKTLELRGIRKSSDIDVALGINKLAIRELSLGLERASGRKVVVKGEALGIKGQEKGLDVKKLSRLEEFPFSEQPIISTEGVKVTKIREQFSRALSGTLELRKGGKDVGDVILSGRALFETQLRDITQVPGLKQFQQFRLRLGEQKLVKLEGALPDIARFGGDIVPIQSRMDLVTPKVKQGDLPSLLPRGKKGQIIIEGFESSRKQNIFEQQNLVRERIGKAFGDVIDFKIGKQPKGRRRQVPKDIFEGSKFKAPKIKMGKYSSSIWGLPKTPKAPYSIFEPSLFKTPKRKTPYTFFPSEFKTPTRKQQYPFFPSKFKTPTTPPPPFTPPPIITEYPDEPQTKKKKPIAFGKGRKIKLDEKMPELSLGRKYKRTISIGTALKSEFGIKAPKFATGLERTGLIERGGKIEQIKIPNLMGQVKRSKKK